MKLCTKCNYKKEENLFYKDKRRKDFLYIWCKECVAKIASKYYINNREKISLSQKEYRKNNKDKIKIKNEKYLLNNIESKKIWSKNYYQSNKEAFNKYQNNKKASCINFKLRCNLRSRLNKLIRQKVKTGSAVFDLGCSIQHLKLHLELFWDKGMTWDNYGNKEGQWSIDHIKPLSKFDLTDRNQLLEAVNFRNLQPMWHVDNIVKYNKEANIIMT